MTLEHVSQLARAAMFGTPHVDVAATVSILGYLRADKREEAGRIYAAIAGERTLPAHIGIKHAQKPVRRPLAGSARVKREGQARRILEDRRDMADRA